MFQESQILKRFPIYSEECINKLKEALEFAEQQSGIQDRTKIVPSTFQSRYADSSEEEQGNLSSDESSQEDVSDFSSAPSDVQNFNNTVSDSATEKGHIQAQSKPSFPAVRGSKNHDTFVKKYFDTLSIFSLPLRNPHDAFLDVAMSLPGRLEKDDIVSVCQAYLSLATNLLTQPVLVIAVRSGRLAAAVFIAGKCVVHRTSTRYTVRKGQGKAQSSQDASRRPKSVGSQLRRAGEQALREDITETVQQWKNHIEQASLILISCPKTMRKDLFDSVEIVVSKDDRRIRRVPLDLGRPTFENVCVIYDVLMTACIRKHQVLQSTVVTSNEFVKSQQERDAEAKPKETNQKVLKEEKVFEIALSEIHLAAKDLDLDMLTKLIEDGLPEINMLAGDNLMTPLHYAAEAASDGVNAALAGECVYELLVSGKADPTIVDIRNRPPYFLASHEKVREAFRKARAELGEEYCRWDEGAKVGPALFDEDIQRKKDKEAEKRRRKKARQKEKKAEEKAKAEEQERLKMEEEQLRAGQEAAKRIRDGLAPKVNSTGRVCDYCQKECKGRQLSQMFKRLDYSYCSTDCVQKHKRELVAKAALSRMGG